MSADPVKALEQVSAQLWTWMRLVQIELEKKGREGEGEGRRWENQEAEYQRRIAALETERTSLLSRCELLKSELRTAKADLEAAKTPQEPRRRDSRSYDVDLYERGRLVGINEGRKEKEEQFEAERQRLQQVAKRYSGSLEDLQRQFQTLQDKYIALMKEPKAPRLDQSDEISQLRREKEDLQNQHFRAEAEWKDTLKRKEEDIQRLRVQADRPAAPPIRSASPARREDAIKLDLLNRRSAALKEIQECERSNRVVDPAMRVYVRELNAALTKYP
jgi:chromosome segregation ATPase